MIIKKRNLEKVKKLRESLRGLKTMVEKGPILMKMASYCDTPSIFYLDKINEGYRVTKTSVKRVI